MVWSAVAWAFPSATMIPAPATVSVPAVPSVVCYHEIGAAKVEEVAARVTGVDAEVPVATVPIQRTVKVGGCRVGAVLPVEQNVTEVEVALPPIYPIEVVA